MGGLAALADRPHDQGLAAAHVSRDEDLLVRRAVIAVVGENVAAPVNIELRFLEQPLAQRTGEADGEEDEIGLEEES